MPRWLNTKGRSTLGIGVCGRCGIKMSLDDLQPDPNFPGLRVCAKDMDVLDPYRLPMRAPDDISLPFVRPDEGIPTNPSGVITEDETYFLTTENGVDFFIVDEE